RRRRRLPRPLPRLGAAWPRWGGFERLSVVRERHRRGHVRAGPGMGCATPSSTRCRVSSASPDEQRCRHEGGNRADESHQMGRCVQGERRGRPGGQGRGHEAEVGWALLVWL
ncbi:hypothetical protein, partial [Streptomyces antimycoticus]|uniref:hypothetical protein n=1 Tax=Streptomyces antimycoticus TaxID=68175 RepID=UPI001F382E58